MWECACVGPDLCMWACAHWNSAGKTTVKRQWCEWQAHTQSLVWSVDGHKICKQILNFPLLTFSYPYPFSIISIKAKSFADREIRYTLKAQGQGAGTFNIGPTSGIVKLAKELDFEDLRQPHVYSLIVTATEDSGGFSTSVDVSKWHILFDGLSRRKDWEEKLYHTYFLWKELKVGLSYLNKI